MLAAKEGQTAATELLLGKGADIDATAMNSCTSLMFAVEGDHTGAMELLLSKGADVEATGGDWTALMLAAEQGQTAAMELLLGKGADVEAADDGGTTALMLAAAKGQTAAMELLLGKGADVKAEDAHGDTPAHLAASNGHAGCLCTLRDHGGATISLELKQRWLAARLEAVVGENPDAAGLDLVASRENLLDGLCRHLGIDESTGEVDGGVLAGPLAIQFQGENGAGDGVRREWFESTAAVIVDERRGLFASKDGGRTLQPNPHSELAGGADHLSYFALLGRIAGLSLYHREHIPAPWTTAFVKAAFGYRIVPADLEAVDPDLYKTKVAYVRDRVYATRDGMPIEDLDPTFEDEFEGTDYTAKGKKRPAPTDLKHNGAAIAVAEDNRLEYLQLMVEHRLVGGLQKQVAAFRNGLGVFFQDGVLDELRQLFDPADVQLLLCGTADIDVDGWQQSAEYEGGLDAGMAEATWFWAAVRALSAEHRAKLLHFSTGSSRAPAAGFTALRGYSGQVHRFRLQLVDGGPERLPAAATCFNTLKLPRYRSEQQTQDRIVTAITGARGFDEAAVAE